MICHKVDKGYVGVEINFPRTKILLQITEDGEQSRAVLTIEEAKDIIKKIESVIKKIEDGKINKIEDKK